MGCLIRGNGIWRVHTLWQKLGFCPQMPCLFLKMLRDYMLFIWCSHGCPDISTPNLICFHLGHVWTSSKRCCKWLMIQVAHVNWGQFLAIWFRFGPRSPLREEVMKFTQIISLQWLATADLLPRKLTWQWKIAILNRKYIFKWWMFHCYVRFRWGIIYAFTLGGGFPTFSLPLANSSEDLMSMIAA